MTEDLLITKLKAIASEIEYEDDLIGQRMSWLVMGQSFLFGAFASLIGRVNANTATHMVNLMRMQIPLGGLLMPILVLFAVSAAIFRFGIGAVSMTISASYLEQRVWIGLMSVILLG